MRLTPEGFSDRFRLNQPGAMTSDRGWEKGTAPLVVWYTPWGSSEYVLGALIDPGSRQPLLAEANGGLAAVLF